jgi:hypothetical protein
MINLDDLLGCAVKKKPLKLSLILLEVIETKISGYFCEKAAFDVTGNS